MAAEGKTESVIFDPFPEEPLMRLLDPRPFTSGTPVRALRIRRWRILSLWGFLVIPAFALSVLPPPFGIERLTGKGIICLDLAFLEQSLCLLGMLFLVTAARRRVALLGSRLVESGIVAAIPDFDRTASSSGWFLRNLEHMTRLDWRRATFWAMVVLGFDAIGSLPLLLDGIPSWQSSPGALTISIYCFERPNLVGFWDICVFCTVLGYLTVLSVRVLATFACLCKAIAKEPSLRIVPPHPDVTGGLLCIGRVATFLSLFTFAVGVQIASVVLHGYLIAESFGMKEKAAYALSPAIVVEACAYLVMGGILFVLPLFPLRAAMLRAKGKYVAEAERLYVRISHENQTLLAEQKYQERSAEAQTALAELIESANQMGNWPFDRNVLVRVVGLIGSPVLGMAAPWIYMIPAWLRRYVAGT